MSKDQLLKQAQQFVDKVKETAIRDMFCFIKGNTGWSDESITILLRPHEANPWPLFSVMFPEYAKDQPKR